MKLIGLVFMLATVATAQTAAVKLRPAARPVRQSGTISWTSDGNPTVPVCGKTHKNCKSTVDIHDNTANTTASVSVSTFSYVTNNPTHSFSIRTSGYDLNGNALHSAYEAVP